MPSSLFTLQFTDGGLAGPKADVVLLGAFSRKEAVSADWPLADLEASASGTLKLLTAEKFEGAHAKLALLRNTSGLARVLIVGLGEKEKLTGKRLTRALAAAVETAAGYADTKTIAIALPETGMEPFSVLLSAADACFEASYTSLEAKKKPPFPEAISLLAGGGIVKDEALLKQAVAAARAKSQSKDLTNMPPNLKRTTTLADRAKSLAGIAHLTVDIVDDGRWIEENMPCFYTVALGSVATDPPKFIRVHYRPPGAKKKIILVGKSVIFDTGGYQVKTDDYMNTMKADMTGGAMVVSVLEAAAALELPVSISAFLAATPNMIDSRAMLPDSIVSTTCGKKVEIRHTDAEGRLTLIDAVAMAAKESPDLIITVATLTGSAARAVGEAIALMGNDNDVRSRFAAAARRAGDPLQTLDIWDEDFEDIKSKLDGADIINTSQNKNRGAQSACAFVMSGLGEQKIPMLHLDIAGADMTKDEKATGIGVKTLLSFLIEESRQ
jgi:leucyl aminopeptidase